MDPSFVPNKRCLQCVPGQARVEDQMGRRRKEESAGQVRLERVKDIFVFYYFHHVRRVLDHRASVGKVAFGKPF